MFSARFKWRLEANRLALLLAQKRRAGARLIDLTQSNPTQAHFDYPQAEILAALSAPEALIYEPAPRGLLPTRQAVADYYRECEQAVDPEQIHLTASTSEGYAYLFKLLASFGDAVLVPQPSYPLFEFLGALEGVELHPYELAYAHPAGWQIDFDSLQRAASISTRAVIVVNPNNPTGSYLKQYELERLVAFCAERELALIVDEVFSDYALTADAQRVTSLVSVNEALTFVLSGLSKTVALPQMKLGWIITNGPDALRREATERLDLIADTFLSVGAPVQHAVSAWLRLRAALQQQILHRVRGNLARLAQQTWESPCRLLTVEGGWYATLEVPRHASEEEMILALLDEDDVLAHPGYFFDFPREAFLVLSLLTPGEDFQEGVARVMARLGRT
jgi:hypothetical protein